MNLDNNKTFYVSLGIKNKPSVWKKNLYYYFTVILFTCFHYSIVSYHIIKNIAYFLFSYKLIFFTP